MRVAVISCWKYRDTHAPFFELFRKFWPDCPYQVDLLTDGRTEPVAGADKLWVFVDNYRWCDGLTEYLHYANTEVLIFLDDFFLNAPVRQDLIEHALEQMQKRNAGMVRLYPCPGADEDYGDPYVGIVRKGSEYRISSQAGIWRPDFLLKIASQFNTPWEFEIEGTKYAETLPDEVLSWKRGALPFPISYENTAICRGKWTRSALALLDREGISVDLSMREIAS